MINLKIMFKKSEMDSGGMKKWSKFALFYTLEFHTNTFANLEWFFLPSATTLRRNPRSFTADVGLTNLGINALDEKKEELKKENKWQLLLRKLFFIAGKTASLDWRDLLSSFRFVLLVNTIPFSNHIFYQISVWKNCCKKNKEEQRFWELRLPSQPLLDLRHSRFKPGNIAFLILARNGVTYSPVMKFRLLKC